METQPGMSNGGHVACLKHGGMHTATEQYPRRRHVTPLDDWELVPVAELDGTACEGCSPPSAEPQAELQKPRCPKCGSYDTRKATVYWQCNTCHHEWLARAKHWYVLQEYERSGRPRWLDPARST